MMSNSRNRSWLDDDNQLSENEEDNEEMSDNRSNMDSSDINSQSDVTSKSEQFDILFIYMNDFHKKYITMFVNVCMNR